MENNSKTENVITLSEWYNSLPANLQIQTRDKIITDCEISAKTFYNWVKGETIPKKPYRDIIIKIASADIYFTDKVELPENFGLVK